MYHTEREKEKGRMQAQKRRKAMERYSETRKRECEADSDGEENRLKRRKSHNNMVDILKESIEHKKAEQEQLHKLRSREMDL